MQKLTSHLRVMSRGAIALLLAFMSIFTLKAQEMICPDYPRAMDQAYFCYIPEEYTFKLEQEATIHNPVRFKFPALPSNITVTFDAGDGNGPVNVNSGAVVLVTYPTSDQYTLTTTVRFENPEQDPPNPPFLIHSESMKFQAKFNDEGINYSDFAPHETWGEIVGNTYTPPNSAAYPTGSPWNSPVTAGGMVSILYANPDHRFRKPFILIDGFDPVLEGADHFEVTNQDGSTLGYGSVRWDVLMTGREESFDVDPLEPGVPHTPRLANFPSLVQGLRNQGYDIVLVDLADGGTYIQANGEFLIKVIERINNSKVGTFPNALIGASMGGFVGRYALAKMESLGLNHCTGLFGTLDTPHNGANVPLALQAFGWFAHATDTKNEKEKQQPWQAAQTPAARQMLISNLGDEVQSGRITIVNNGLKDQNLNIDFNDPVLFDELYNSDYSVLREQLESELDAFGWPQKPRKIALIDGMKNGSLPGNHGYSAGAKFYQAKGYLTPDFADVFRVIMRSSNGGGPDIYAVNGVTSICIPWVAPVFGVENSLLSITQPAQKRSCFGFKIPHTYNSITLKSNTNLPQLDNAPGGYRMDMRAVNASIKSGIEGEGAAFSTAAYFPIATFVPTWSALAMATPLTNPNLFVDLTNAEFAEENLPNAKVPNFDNFYAPTANLRHVELDGGMVAFILTELALLNASPQEGVLTEAYNYGKQYKEIPNTIVASTGRLNINNTGPTGFASSNPPGPLAVRPVFTTYLRDCGQSIVVEAGGQYNIGALDKSQHGRTEVWESGVVHIKSGGTLHITSENSQLYIKHGATLIIDPGAIVFLESQGSNILIEGDLIVNGDFKFSGLGFFDFSNGNKLEFGPGYNTFNLKGAGKDKRFVRLSDFVSIDAGHRLNWSSGLVEVADFIQLTDGAGLNFTNMTLTGIDAGITAIDALNSGSIMLERCEVNHLDQAIYGKNGQGCTISASAFSVYNDTQVKWENTGTVQILYSVFDGANSSNAINAVWLENVVNPVIKGSSFQNHGDPTGAPVSDNMLVGAGAAVELFNVGTCLVSGSTFSNNGVGIKSRDADNASNVYVYGGCQFSNNDAGIFVRGDQTRGTVLSDCSLFDNNITGIRGRDITLMIDSWNSSTWPLDTDSPNRFFRNPVGKYIHILYDLKAIGMSNRMRNNFWGNPNAPDLTPNNAITLQNATGVVAAELFPVATREPDCLPSARPPALVVTAPDTDCPINTVTSSSSVAPVHEQFQLGAFLLRTENYDAGIEALRPVAALWQPDMLSISDNCHQYINIAKAIVDGNDLPGQPRSGGSRDQVVSKSELQIAPNPAHGSAIVYCSNEQYQVKIWDLQGRLMHQAEAIGNHLVETAEWPAGIYLVEAITPDGTRKTGKLIVQ